MTSSVSGGSPHDSVGAWLRRLAMLAAVVLLAFCSWFVWRLSMVAYQMEAAIVAISADVKQMSSTGVQISDHLKQLDVRLRAIEEKAADAMNLDEMEHILGELSEVRGARSTGATSLSADSEREIKHLLSQIRRSPHRFTYSDENKGGMRMYLQLYTKYKAYENVIASAEDFIERVGTIQSAGIRIRSPSMALTRWRFATG